MSYQELVKQGERTFENICNVDKQKLFQNPNNLQPWNGLGFDLSKQCNGKPSV
jgi:hypothetical protein